MRCWRSFCIYRYRYVQSRFVQRSQLTSIQIHRKKPTSWRRKCSPLRTTSSVRSSFRCLKSGRQSLGKCRSRLSLLCGSATHAPLSSYSNTLLVSLNHRIALRNANTGLIHSDISVSCPTERHLSKGVLVLQADTSSLDTELLPHGSHSLGSAERDLGDGSLRGECFALPVKEI